MDSAQTQTSSSDLDPRSRGEGLASGSFLGLLVTQFLGATNDNVFRWLAVGIGVNVCKPVPPEVAGRAASLCELLPEVRRIDVLDLVVPALDAVSAGGEPLTEAERAAFTARHRLEGAVVRAPVAGRVCGIAPDGALLVDTPDGRVPVRDGPVTPA